MEFQLVFVLIGTTHTGNIGAAARAIKNMGFSELRLVDCCSHLTKDAIARASGADGVLKNAQRFDSLDVAVADCNYVYGTSARDRHLSVPVAQCREVAGDIATVAHQSGQPLTVAMVFGRERSGLSNEEMDRCTRLLRIPCNPDFSSLNLAAAVQVVAYECALALQNSAKVAPVPENSVVDTNEESPASSEAMLHFYEHLNRVMVNTGFLDPDNPKQLSRRIKRYFERNRPSHNEINILRGILSATERPHPPKKDPD